MLPLDLPLLVRDIDPERAAMRHQARLAEGGVTISLPRKTAALNGMAMVGLVIDRQESVVEAVCGTYPAAIYSDKLPALRRQYPALSMLFDTTPAPISEVRGVYQDAIDTLAADHPHRLPLGNLYRAWALRQWVQQGRPVRLTAAVFGLTEEPRSFSPVVTRLGDTRWQLGRAGDVAPVSPQVFEGDTRQAWTAILATYADWQEKDRKWQLAPFEAQASRLAHFGLFAWITQLRRRGELHLGTLKVQNVSHGNLLRFSFPDRTLLVRGYVERGVRLAIAMAGQYPPLPPVAEVETALAGGPLAVVSSPAPQLGKPLDAQITGAYQGQDITVAWLEHPVIRAVVSGQDSRVRAALLENKKQGLLGAAPFSFKTRKPDRANLWATTPCVTTNNDDIRRMLSAWLIRLWRQKNKST